jgi:hypothetical protein
MSYETRVRRERTKQKKPAWRQSLRWLLFLTPGIRSRTFILGSSMKSVGRGRTIHGVTNQSVSDGVVAGARSAAESDSQVFF